MNYRHAYHAGNFADVVKHILLLQLLDQLSHKGKPYYVLDAYAGRGLYSLASAESKKTKEADLGIRKLELAKDTQHNAITQYLARHRAAKRTYDNQVYPGSPWWIADHVQAHSHLAIRAEAFEKQASEYDALNYQLHQLPIGVQHRDALDGIMAVIPPKERRGLIFLDPPYEQEHKNFTSLVEALTQAMNKWPQGIYALWYPIKNADTVALFHKKLKRTGLRRLLICEWLQYPRDVNMGLNGSGLLVINPPWQFDQNADAILTELHHLLKPEVSLAESVLVKWLVGE